MVDFKMLGTQGDFYPFCMEGKSAILFEIYFSEDDFPILPIDRSIGKLHPAIEIQIGFCKESDPAEGNRFPEKCACEENNKEKDRFANGHRQPLVPILKDKSI